MEYRAKNRVLTEWLNSYEKFIIKCAIRFGAFTRWANWCLTYRGAQQCLEVGRCQYWWYIGFKAFRRTI